MSYSRGVINIPNVTGDIVITAVATRAELLSITAVYTQSGTVYDTDSLDSLKSDLVVTATYADSSTATVTDYTLSGTLAEGTSTITVSYGGKTDTFGVTVTHRIVYYSVNFNGENASYTGDTSIESGNSLSATISCVGDYYFSAVTIRMGETDITSTAYTATNSRNGAITIQNVTGDVVILAETAEWAGDDVTSTLVWNEGVWINGNNVTTHSNQTATSPIDVQGYTILTIYAVGSFGTSGVPSVLGLAQASDTSGTSRSNREGKQYWSSGGGTYPNKLTYDVSAYNYARIGTTKDAPGRIGVILK